MLIMALTINYFWLKFVKLRIEDNQALRFILDDEIYLLDEDKNTYSAAPEPQPVTQTPVPVFNYLGANKKNFLVLVHYPGDEFMPADHLDSLEKVLAGKRMSKEDTAILNLAKHPEVTFDSLKAHFTPKTLVVLGKNAPNAT